MAEYTYEDIIMDPEDPRLENAIGKECYLSDYPREALKHAINHTIKYRLKSINKEEICPFVDDEDEDNWACIIIKKEEPKPEFMPFKNISEFINAYRSVASWLGEQDLYLNNRGIWLKDKDIDDVFYIVTEIWKDGVVLGSDQSTTKWDDLLFGYTFLDGTPCGKPMEE